MLRRIRRWASAFAALSQSGTGRCALAVGRGIADRHRAAEQRALQRRRVLQRHRHQRMQLLPDARHGEEHGRRDLAEVLEHRVGALGEMHDAAIAERAQRRHHALGHVAERQERQRVVALGRRRHVAPAVDREDEIAVREDGALGRAGGARRVDEDRAVGGLNRIDEFVPAARTLRLLRLAERQQLGVAHDQRLAKMLQAGHVVDDDALELRHPRAALEHLVELLFVLDEQEARAAVVDDVFDLLARRGGIEPDRDRAEPDDAHVGPEPFGNRLGEDRGDLARLQSQLGKSQPDPPRALAIVAPRDLLPEAEILVQHGNALAARSGGVAKQLRDRVAAGRDEGEIVHRHCFRRFQRRTPRTPASRMPR